MRFLRVSLASLMILAMVAASALAAESATDTATDTTESGSATESGSTDPEASTDPTVTDVVYGAKLSGQVLSITPPDGETPGTITMLVAGQEVTFTFTADMLEGEVSEGSYVELKGTTQALEKIEASDEDEDASTEFKSAVVGVTPASEGGSAMIVVMIGGQELSFNAEELGIPAETMEMVTAGAEVKFETNEDGEAEMKISSEAGVIKVEVKEDGSVEVKVESGEKKGKGHEISEQKKAEAQARKEAAKAKAEDDDDDDDDDDEDEDDDDDDEDEDDDRVEAAKSSGKKGRK